MSFGKAPKKDAGALDGLGLTKETRTLLDDVLKQRNLSLRAAQDVASSIQRGDASWVDRVNTGVAAFNAPPSKTTKQLVKVPKVGRGVVGLPPPMPPASFSGKRMNIAPVEREHYAPRGPGPDREAEKDRCAQVMELGARGLRERQAQVAELERQAAKAAATARPLDVREALVEQLVTEIQERNDFLDAMRAAGRGDAYEAQVRGEISERMFQLKKYGVDVGAPPAARKPAAIPPWQRPPSAPRGGQP